MTETVRRIGTGHPGPGRPAGSTNKVHNEKDLYDETIKQVWGVLRSRKLTLEDRKPFLLAIMRWQGKLDQVDDKHVEELRKLMGKRTA